MDERQSAREGGIDNVRDRNFGRNELDRMNEFLELHVYD